MDHWQADLLGVFAEAQSAAEIFTLIESAAGDLGYEHCAYGLRSSLPLSNPRVIIHSNYAEAWRERYTAAEHLLRDPTVRHAASTCIPLAWSAQGDGPDRAFWSEARDHGLRHGWCQSTIDRQGVAGMLTLARGCEPLTASELAYNEIRMRWLVNVAHVHMTRVYGHRLHAGVGTAVRLSNREVQVLRWTGDGKTSSEIAEILTLSVDTVNHHIGNAVQKLQCANRTAAVVKALTMGLLL